MSDAKLEAYFFTAVLLITFTVVLVIFYPFFGALALAVVLATLVSPVYKDLNIYIKNKSVSAFIVTLMVLLAIIIPATGLFFLLLDEVNSLLVHLMSYNFADIPSFLMLYKGKLVEILPVFDSVSLSEVFQGFVQGVGSYVGNILTNMAGFILKFLVAVIALYYFIRDGERFIEELIKLSPLVDYEDRAIVEKLNNVAHSLIRGTLVIAVLQGVLTGFGFFLFGVPSPILWGSVAAFGALIPTIGTSVVSIPAVIYLFFTGHTVAAIGLAAWAMLFVGLIDNILGPRLIGNGAKIHPLFVLLSVLGGLAVFGISGFLLGPLVFGFLLALAEIYKIKIIEIHKRSESCVN